MRRYVAWRAVPLALLACLLVSGCGGGGIGALVVTAKGLYGVWKLYQLFNDGFPAPVLIEGFYTFGEDSTYLVEYRDEEGSVLATESGTWRVRDSALVLRVEQSDIHPETVGTTVRLPAEFADESGETLSLTRPEGAVTQEQVYKRQAPEVAG